MEQNPVGLNGMEFIEYSGPVVADFERIFGALGFTLVAKHKSRDLRLYRQGDINFVLNNDPDSFAAQFKKLHGQSVCSTGFRVHNAQKAFETAVSRGARPFEGDLQAKSGWKLPAIYGIGDSLVYFVDNYEKQDLYEEDFEYVVSDRHPKGKGLLLIDHMTNNVPKGEMQKWCDFYEKVFNFKERRYFDIRGETTGLISKVMGSPCGKIMIPINEPSDPKSQIQEYLDEYKGSGIQHIALLTEDILSTVDQLHADGIKFLNTPDTYYDTVLDRVPKVTESLESLRKQRILVDGDPEGYLLQIFTENQFGPVFIEIIQRKNHFGFGNGNFQALFDAIERDQRARGVL